jgi:CheY-like chemotaxis protein
MTEETNLPTTQRAPEFPSGAARLAQKDHFERHLRKVLACLYDPTVLRGSPLVQLFGIERDPNMASALRRTLLQSIESLRPNEATPPGTKAWRVYQILRRRYTEQLTQREVASALGLSTRQLQREEKIAREVLADRLWTKYRLAGRAHLLEEGSAHATDVTPLEPRETRGQVLTRTRELAHLRDSVPVKDVDLHQVIVEVLETIDPLRESLDVPIVYTSGEDLPLIRLQVPMLRQALLNLVNVAIGYFPTQIEVCTGARPREVFVEVRALSQHDAHAPEQDADSLDMASQLIQLCQGSLHIASSAEPGPAMPAFSARIVLQAEEQITVLVIDDNEDVLRLFRRYMSGSRYRFVGAQSADQGRALATEPMVEDRPQIIVLDVMMPEQDGWTLLGLFREHPQTQGVPVIVCTILPQEQLALTLGAAEFIRKPVNRSTLLSVLDRQVDRVTREAATSRR